MMGESDALYRDPDKFSSSEDECDDGEEGNSVLMDAGMNSLDDMQIKFKALEEEREERAHTQTVRRELRRNTRAAQLAEKQIKLDKQHGRPTRELTAEEVELLKGASTLHDRLKAEKAAESAYWNSKFHHQRRPERKKQVHVENQIRERAAELAQEEIGKLRAAGSDPADKVARKGIMKRIYVDVMGMASEIFDRTEITSEKDHKIKEEKEGRLAASKELARKVTEEEVARAAGEEVQPFVLPSEHYQGVWELERKALGLPKAKTSLDQGGQPPEYDDPDDDDGDGPLLEDNPIGGDVVLDDDDDGDLQLEENPTSGPALDDIDDDDDELQLEENPVSGPALVEEDDDCELELEDNGPGLGGDAAAKPKGTLV